MSRKSFKAGALLAPVPAVLVSVGNMEEHNLITVAWTGILSTDPPRAYISVRKSRHSYEILKRTGEFVINLTTERLALATDYSGIYTGAKVDKFAEVGLTPIESAEVSAPTVSESPLSLECRVFDIIESGTHDIFMADIVSVSADESIIDDSGRICFERAGLMTYAHGEYFALGRKLGKFGYSTDKKNKGKIKLAPTCEEKKKAETKSAENKISPKAKNGMDKPKKKFSHQKKKRTGNVGGKK